MKQGTMNILFFILKTKLLKNGEAPILMRITIDGHYEEARIQRSVLPKQWDSAKGCSKGKDRTAKELNAYIAELSALAFQKHKELMLELALITPKLLLKRVFGKRDGNAYPARYNERRNRKNEKGSKHRLRACNHQPLHQRDEKSCKRPFLTFTEKKTLRSMN